MKVLITTIPVQDIQRPPGIMSILAGCCESVNCDYSLLDLNLFMYKNLQENIVTPLVTDLSLNKFNSIETQKNYDIVCDHFIERVRVEQPTHIAISVFTYASILSADYLLKRLYNSGLTKNYKVIIGGLGITDFIDHITKDKSFAEYCLANNLIDYYILGEGDIAFTELLKNNTSYPGINSKQDKQIDNLNSLPLPSYKKINPGEYYYTNSPEVLITGSRGCVRDCSFCDVGYYWSKYVFKSGERIAEEVIEIWKSTGVQKFEFSDSLVNGSLKSFRAFNKEIIKYKSIYPDFNPQFKGQFICRPKGEMKRQDYIDMAHAGMDTLVIGIESFSEHVRTHMRKKFSNEDIDYHFELCGELGLHNLLLLITGYVNETAEDHQDNLTYIKKYQAYALGRIIYAIQIQVSGLVINKGAPLYDMLDELHIVFPEYNNDKIASGQFALKNPDLDWISLNNPTLTAKERLRRGVELVALADEVGYQVASFNTLVEIAEQKYHNISADKHHKIFKIRQTV